jgi:hypothetical protein
LGCDCVEHSRIVRIDHQRHPFLLRVLVLLRWSLISYFHSIACRRFAFRAG